jgi:hypothetical protein
MRAQLARPSLALRFGLAVCGLAITTATAASYAKADPGKSQIYGEWKGQSIVVAKDSAAKDEVQVWHISPTKDPSKVKIKADRIVNGRSITMGIGDWDYDKSKKTITWKTRLGVWQLTLDGNTLKGTLTLNDQTVFRRVSLEKSAAAHAP